MDFSTTSRRTPFLSSKSSVLEEQPRKKNEMLCYSLRLLLFPVDEKERMRTRGKKPKEKKNQAKRVIRVILVVREESRELSRSNSSQSLLLFPSFSASSFASCLGQEAWSNRQVHWIKKAEIWRERESLCKKEKIVSCCAWRTTQDKSKLPKIQFNQRSTLLLISANETNGDADLSEFSSCFGTTTSIKSEH